MGVKAELYRAYSEREGKVKAIPFLMKLLGFDSIETGEDEEVWRSTEEGKHFSFETTTGEIKKGFGGRFTGKKIGESWGKKKSGEAKNPKSAVSEIPQSHINAAAKAVNYADFWYQLPEEEQKKFEGYSQGIKEAYEKAKTAVPEGQKQSEWKPAFGSASDMPKKCKVPEKIAEIKVVNNPDDTATAHAGQTGEIEINLANFDKDAVDQVIAHEAAHQLSNYDPELQAAIISNYGDVLGRYNQEKGHFEGIYGEYNPEEAFATGFSNYLNHPESMKDKYPEAYQFFDQLVKNQPEAADYIRGTVEKAKEALGDQQPAKGKRIRPESRDEVIEMLAGKNNLLTEKKYKDALKNYSDANKKHDELAKEWLEIGKKLDQEIRYPDDEARELGRQYAELFEWYTPEGKKLLEKKNELFKQLDEAEKERSKYSDELDSIKRAKHQEEVSAWREPELKETKKTHFDGFKLESDVSGIQEKIENGQAKIVEMSPKEHLERCAFQIFSQSTLENTLTGTSQENVNKYADAMENGDEFPIPYLDFTSSGQEGRHRALAAMMNGYETIPVAIIGKRVKRAGADEAPAEDEEIWRTSEAGRHFKFETETGEVKAGFGGKLTGKKLGEKFNPKTESTEVESPKSVKPASAPQSQPAAVSEAKTKWQSDLEKRRGIAMKWSPDRQAEFLNNQGFLDYDAAVEAMENGTAGAQLEKYFAIQAKSGDPTPTKKVLDPKDVRNTLRERLNENGDDWDAARKSMMREFTGMSVEETEEAYRQMDTWFGGSWNRADTDVLDAYIDRDGACKGKLYRGLKFSEEEYQAFMKGLEPGATINMRGMNSSWSTSEEVAWNFYHGAEHEVKITCVANRTASPVDFISTKGEYEVLAHSRARWTVLGVNEGPGRTEITVVEAGEFMSVEERDRLKKEHANDAAPEKAEKQVSLAQRMQEQAVYMTVEPASLEFVAQMKREHPEWF